MEAGVEVRPCRAPSGLAFLLEELGLCTRTLISALPNPKALSEPRPWLSIEDYFSLWEAISAQAQDPMFGGLLGQRAAERVILEPVFLACLGSRDLEEALGRLSSYKVTLCPERLDLHRAPGAIEVRYGWPTAPRPAPPLLVEAELCFLLQLARSATRAPIDEAQLGLTRPRGDAAQWRARLGAHVRFGEPSGSLRLPQDVLRLPFTTFNPSLLAALEPGLVVERAAREREQDVVARVRHELELRVSAGQITLEDVAPALAMSVRTLQRRLREANTSFGRLLQEARCARAKRLLCTSDLALAEVAFLVGFDSVPAFCRAFARWTGLTPARFRQGRQARSANGLAGVAKASLEPAD